jgi:hypothetical protein
MPAQLLPSERLQRLFQRRKCWMLADLARSLDYALISVRRLLKQTGYLRSYTHNGKWYTLRDSPAFNHDGLWWHRQDIGFSKHGSLIATMVYLVARSAAGLSARELGEKLHHPCHAVLTNLHKTQVLDRIKVGGEFRYLAAEEQINRRQREQAAVVALPGPTTSLATQAAVWVLVEHIRNPALSFQQIAARLLEQRAVAVAPESIQRFFQEHDLKKTPEAPS